MLLRSVTQHVKDQNWLAVVIDFFIVVVGVFLGIQVANWNATQVQKKAAQVAVERVQAELSRNQEIMQGFISYLSVLQTHASSTQDWLARPVDERDAQFVVDVYMVTSVSSLTLSRDAYNDFLSLGPSKALIDEGILQGLANYYFFLETQIYVLEKIPAYRDHLRSIIPFDVQLYIRRACPIKLNIIERDFSIIENCQPNLSDEQVERVLAELSAVDFKREVNLVLSDLYLKTGLLRLFQRTSEELVDLI